MSRKTLILSCAVFAVAASAVPSPASPRRADATCPVGETKNVILFVGDGMQLAHEIATSRYLYGRDQALSFHALPYQGSVATWDVTTYNKYAPLYGKTPYNPWAIVPRVGYDHARGGLLPWPLVPVPDESYFATGYATDSASAATAWATGWKTDDGNVAWAPGDPAGGALKTIAELLRERKDASIGVVSTVPFTHATPAAHVAHNKSRSKYHEIAAEILNVVKPDVVIGGGHPEFGSSETYMPQSLLDGIRSIAETPGSDNLSAEWELAERGAGRDGALWLLTAAQRAADRGKRLFGLFGGLGGNFESPEPQDLPGTPLVLRASLENPLLRDATLAALKVLGTNENGFFVMIEQGDIDWANHANDFQRMVGTTWDLHDAVRAAMDWVNQPGDGASWCNTLLIVTSDHSNSYMRIRKPLGAGDLPLQTGLGSCGYGGAACTYPDGEVTYGSTGHTNELVRLYAVGQNAHLFRRHEGRWYRGTRLLDNTQIFDVMSAATGLALPFPDARMRLVAR
jgi:alkaline phosphatase